MNGRRQLSLVIAAALLAPVASGQLAAPSADEVAKMQAAAPEKARIAPEKPRKLLVFCRQWGYQHTAVPYGAKAVEIMAQKTKAFEPVFTYDDTLFEPDKIGQFDAILFNNTNNEIFLPEPGEFAKLSPEEQAKARQRDEMLKKSFADYLRNGGGLAVIHAGVASFRQWQEFGEIVGARFDNHPWTEGSTVVLRVEEPNHPLAAAFKEPYFTVTDEIYQLADPYSRDALRVLLVVDPDKTTTTPEQMKLVHRKDKDFAMTYIKTYGRGRVFYNAFGHQHDIYWNPVILQHYLDGIQYALGDLKADATPSAKIRK